MAVSYSYQSTATGRLCPGCGMSVWTMPHTCYLAASVPSSIEAVDFVTQGKLDEILRILRTRNAKPCFICGNESIAWTDMPYGSFYDGSVVCGDCCAKYIDPLLDLVRVAKGEVLDG